MLAEQSLNNIYDSLPLDIVGTLDNMAHGIAIKERLDPMDVKTKMVTNINKLTQNKAEFLVASMSILIDRSTQHNETIDDKNTKKEFISFLISLYY
ncbi:MAG: hypothetical protein KAQ94_00305 [Arcobacteraceae bacterium]|nr:hypothetical protein [Arcobacteraceae bacterium]